MRTPKKICFVAMGNLYLCPYLPIYTQFLDGDEYSVIYWDREFRNEEQEGVRYYRYEQKVDTNEQIKKLLGYFRFKRFAERVLNENDFDLVVLLQTMSAVLLSRTLITKYCKRYIIDIRDYAHERIPLIANTEERIIPKSLFTVISSEGYKDFLPDNNYLICHNIRDLDRGQVNLIRGRNHSVGCIHIAYIGYVNYQDQHKKLIKLMNNDPRFKLSFIGTRALELETYCNEIHADNVTLVGTFDSSQILDFYNDVHVINNLYGNNTPTLDYALSNKLYFAADLHIPILVCPNTYMEKVAKDYGIGLSVNLDDPNAANQIFDYYTSLDWGAFESSCDDFMGVARLQQNKFLEMIRVSFGVEEQ